jgi:hypothetical protein
MHKFAVEEMPHGCLMKFGSGQEQFPGPSMAEIFKLPVCLVLIAFRPTVSNKLKHIGKACMRQFMAYRESLPLGKDPGLVLDDRLASTRQDLAFAVHGRSGFFDDNVM